MAKAQKLSLGCLGLIKPEVELIRTILRTSSRLDSEWVLVEDGECDAILIYNPDKTFAPFQVKPTTKIITIKRRGEPFADYVFYKPFRADELIDTLILIKSNMGESSSQSTAPQAPQKSYKLKKWPPADLLALDKNYMLLAVHLSRSTKTVQDLVTLSGRPENFCAQFLSLLESKNLLHADINIRNTSQFNTPVNNDTKSQKKTFFSLLRDRLGLSR